VTYTCADAEEVVKEAPIAISAMIASLKRLDFLRRDFIRWF
jgi:hypothetical protein